MIIDWYVVTIDALTGIWQGFLIFIPNLIGALIIFIIGWFIALGIGKLVSEILTKIKFNQVFETSNWRKTLEKADVKVNPAEFIGAIFKWVLVIVFLMVAVEILGFVKFADFLDSVVGYLGNVVVASLIFVVATLLADILAKVMVAATESVKFEYSHMAGEIVKWSIWIFAILAILHQLGVAQPLVETLLTGLVGVVVISLGLAFGLGGKDAAADMIENFRERVKK
jgi:small-conductance mechanosensitive channel